MIKEDFNMKVCIFTRSIFKLGGTKRVITMVANEMAKEGKDYQEILSYFYKNTDLASQ